MYATIRRYSVRDAARATDTMRDLARRVEKNFLPMLQDVQGFHGYYVLNANDRELVTISIFESAAGAQESTRRAADFVRSDPAQNQMGTPEVIEGELMISKEAATVGH